MPCQWEGLSSQSLSFFALDQLLHVGLLPSSLILFPIALTSLRFFFQTNKGDDLLERLFCSEKEVVEKKWQGEDSSVVKEKQ
jgi:hypothetical protein